MRCKCCGEKAEFTVQEEDFFNCQYKCSNCSKTFSEKKGWWKSVGTAASVLSIVGTVSKVVTNNIPDAIEAIAERFTDDDIS